MLIGLTYDLRQEYLDAGYGAEETAEFDRAETIDAIESALHALGHETDRIGGMMALVERLARGDRWDLVFNVAEGLHGLGREAQVPALLDAYKIPYTFSDPLTCALTLHKGMAKRVIRDLGLPTPAFAVIESERDIGRVNLPMPVFAKPVAEGTSKGISAASRITSSAQLQVKCRSLLKKFGQPVLVEEYLPGRELTVGMTGTGEAARCLAALEVLLLPGAEPGAYSYANKSNYEGLVRYELARGPIADEAAGLALAAWRGLGCRDGGRVDLRADAGGRLNFLEVNPLPGLSPTISDLPILAGLAGVSYQELIRRIVESATHRVSTCVVRESPA